MTLTDIPEGYGVSDYERGYAAGISRGNRDALQAVAAIVMSLGGEVRVGRKYLLESLRLTVHQDPKTMEEVFRAEVQK